MKLKRLILFLVLLSSSVAMSQTVEASWESLNKRGYPQWFRDAKLGIFVHWGLYSVPAYAGKEGYGEWFYRGLMLKDSGRCQIMSLFADTSLPINEQYASLVDYWHGELWNPNEWARLFKSAGAKYVMLVTKHHDGYCLWDSPQQPTWNSTVSGPHRNIVEELANAVRGEGLRMGFYYSLPEWNNPLHIWMQDPDSSIGDYVDNYMVPQFKELVSRYRPDAIFADGDWQNNHEDFHSEELIAWYYNLVGPDAIVNDRWGRGTQHGFKTPEYSAGIDVQSVPWAECRGIGRSFGFNRNEDLDNFLTDRELIRHFCDLVAHGGGLTLNVGPMADGTIPFIQQERLINLGRWLQTNGEAIYGTHPYIIASEQEECVAAMPNSTAVNFDWVRNSPLKGMPVDNFTVRWRGVTSPSRTACDCIIRVEGDDEIWVLGGDDTLLYYNHNWADNDRAQKTIHLDENSVWVFDVILKEKDLESSAKFTWSMDGGKTFTPVYADFTGVAEWQHTIRCFTAKEDNVYIIEFERHGQTLSIPSLPHLKKNTIVTLLGTSNKLRWKQDNNGTLHIDLSGVNQRELNALENAWVFKVGRGN